MGPEQTPARFNVELEQTFIDVELTDGTTRTIEVGKDTKALFITGKTGRELSPIEMRKGMLKRITRPMSDYVSKETFERASTSGRAVTVQAFSLPVAPGAFSLQIDDYVCDVLSLKFRLLLSVAPPRM